MKRPLFVIGVSFFVATWLAFSARKDSLISLSAAFALSAVLCFLLRDRIKHAYTLCVVLLVSSSAFAGIFLYFDMRVEPLQSFAGRAVVVEGIVTEMERNTSGTVYTMRANFVNHPEFTNVRLVIRSADEPECGEGDVVMCRVKLALPPQDSPWHRARGIFLTGRLNSNIRLVLTERYTLTRTLMRVRNSMSYNVYSKLTEQTADVVTAMVLGMKNNVSPEVQTAASRSGTVHLLSVSGLHLSVLAAFASAILKRLKCPPRLSAGISIVLIFVFSFMVGFGASVFRSFVMTALALSGRMLSKRGDSLTSLGAALLICGIAMPYWVLNWGLWLSAGSTLGIILFAEKLTNVFCEKFAYGSGKIGIIIKAISSAGAVSVSAYAFTLPILLLMSGWISLISPLANILIAPFVPIVILGGIACAAVPGMSAPVIAPITDISTASVIRISEILGGLPFATISIDESYLLIWLMGVCAFAALLVSRRADKKLATYALALSLLSFSMGDMSLMRANHDKVELVTLEKCDAALLIRGGDAVILGTPDSYEISGLLRYLDFRGIKGVPAIIATDCGEQVGSGLLRLIQSYSVDCVIGPNDAYIVDMIESALPGIPVYPGGYAAVTALGGVEITTSLPYGDIYVSAGKNQIVKIHAECDIMESADENVLIYNDGVMLLPRRIPPAFEPLGGYLFGESRILLDI